MKKLPQCCFLAEILTFVENCACFRDFYITIIFSTHFNPGRSPALILLSLNKKVLTVVATGRILSSRIIVIMITDALVKKVDFPRLMAF